MELYFFFFLLLKHELFLHFIILNILMQINKKRQVKTQFDSLEFSADNVNKRFIEKENNLTNL